MTKQKLAVLHTPINFLLVVVALFSSICLLAKSSTSPSTAIMLNTIFNVRDYGALGDGKNLDSPAINKAIDAAVKVGGGTVFIPAGIYLSGSIHMQSNINLHIGAGATLLGAPQEMNAYDETEPYSFGPYQDGPHSYFHNSLIWGENLKNISITGNGTINGGGLTRYDDEILNKMNGHDDWKNPTKASSKPLRLGNKAIAFKLCTNVLVRDITILHGGHFALLLTGCDLMTLDNLTIDTNRDGIDIDACRNTTVSNCRVNGPGDDAIVLKSSFALGRHIITENITITNCQVFGFEEGTLVDGTMKPRAKASGRIKLGTESSGGFRNIAISNCTFRGCRGLAIEQVDGGILENVTITNITMMDLYHYAIFVATGSRNRSPKITAPSSMKNVLISNIIADGVDMMSGIQIMGLPEKPIDGLRLENIRLISKGGGTAEDAKIKPRELGDGYPEPYKIGTLPAYGIFARHVKNLELANISTQFLTEDQRPGAMFSNIQGLVIDNVKLQVAKGVPTALFASDVTDVTINNSPSIKK